MLSENDAKTLDEQSKLFNELWAFCESEKFPEEAQKKWKEFQSNHTKLLKVSWTDTPYFNKKLFEQLKAKVDKITKTAEKSKSDPDVKNITEELATTSRREHATVIETQVERSISPTDSYMDLLEAKMRKLEMVIQEATSCLEENNIQNMSRKKDALKYNWEKVQQAVTKVEFHYRRDSTGAEDIDDLEERTYLLQKELERAIEKEKTRVVETPKLPETKLPNFYGDSKDWAIFYGLFTELIHDRKDLSDAIKLNYLKSCVRGEAKTMISHLLTGSAANYQAAWDFMVKRYENKRKIFADRLEELLNLPQLNVNCEMSIKKYLDTINECVFVIKEKSGITDEANPIFAHLILRNFDQQLMQQYENHTKKSRNIQNLEDVIQFIEQIYNSFATVRNEAILIRKEYGFKKPKQIEWSCKFCKTTGHTILRCQRFKAISVEEKNSFVRTMKLCNRCLSHPHHTKCTKNWFCQECNLPHNTMLHLAKKKPLKENISSNMTYEATKDTLLATALVKVRGMGGQCELLRALIDNASQRTIISEEAAQLLRLPRIKSTTEVSGVSSEQVEVAKYKMVLNLKPRFSSDYSVNVEAIVLPKLNKSLPMTSFKTNEEEWKNVILADPDYNRSSRIDIVIGADVYPEILLNDMNKINGLLGQQTAFGWILSGNITRTSSKKTITAMTTMSLAELERFWEMEKELDEDQNKEDDICEENFKATTKIDTDGKFVVTMPFKNNISLGDSRKQAMARLLNLEKKFNNSARLKEEYTKFMEEYKNLGHMIAADKNKGLYYLPHQPVWRESSTTTKLRVVFDASAKTSNGLSLNDVMYTGPRLQKDIFDIMIKWRSWRYVLSADIEKMYRQIKITENDQRYQYILWRENSSEPIQEFKLTTVTYGTASAPFLAVRTLQETANYTASDRLHEIIKEDFYMDDLLTGADTVEECNSLYRNVTQHLNKFGFYLRKWISNSPYIREVFEDVNCNDVIAIGDEEAIKTLGLQWDPLKDVFRFKIILNSGEYTMRTVLSTLAKIFDPLGWLSPVTTIGKLLIQRLWIEKKTWDQQLDGELLKLWSDYLKQLPMLEKVEIPRWIKKPEYYQIELHGFADASEKAYAAVVYVKVGSSVTILAAKTKVNPIKNRKTIPKLELCAAHLLAKLLDKIRASLKGVRTIYCWSDSKITLAWILNEKHKEKFIRTRVSEIKDRLPEVKWLYVKSEENPADVASRGILPAKLHSHKLWWSGPAWLSLNEGNWPNNLETDANVVTIAYTTTTQDVFSSILNKYSNITKLDRVIAYILRFIGRMRKNKYPVNLSIKELKEARKVVIKQQQRIDFLDEIQKLKTQKHLETRTKILPLNPFLDDDGILRVGGRLQNSNLPYNSKHPVILTKGHISSLLIKEAHQITLHGGIGLVRNYIQSAYWIIGLKNQLKKYIRSCVTCTRYKQEKVEQLMGSLPESRMTMTHPFINAGVDYAGPIKLKCSKGRGLKTFKGYIAVFVCMTTKAIHLEPVSDLSTESFLAALRRFFARRGKSANLYSDNGTNFVGAARQLDEDKRKSMMDNVKIAQTLINEGVQWHFIPPGAPHFGGLWEAGVKSVKYHLQRVIGDTILTFEEMCTLLYQIEAVLNSRPLYSTGNEVDDRDILTPGHFLIGRPLLAAPESINDEKIGALDRWKLIQKIRLDFWKKWKEDYLVSLQQRNKWRRAQPNLEQGQIVLIKNETTHPAKWPMGKIEEVHPGADRKVRVVTVKTVEGLVKRPITKLVALKTKEIQEELPMAKNNRFKPSEVVMFSTMMLMLMQVANAALPAMGAIYNSSVTRLDNTSALYLESMGQVDITTSSWNLVIYYEMKPYFESLQKSDELLEKMRNICHKLDLFEVQCETVIRNMRHRLDNINENNKLFANNKRTKRSALPIVGSFLHILFGVMDEDDRDVMEGNMRNILANQYDLRELAKNQTSVIDSTINILQRTTDEVNSHFTEMHDRIDNMTTILNKNYLVYRESIKFFMISKQISDLIDEAEKTQTQIIGLLMDINHGKVNPALLTPFQLKKEIVHIKEHLPDKLALPGRGNNEMKAIYTLLQANGMFVDSMLVIQARIPLLNRQPSKIYRVIPIPINKGSTRMMPRISSPYLIYNFELDAYHLMTLATFNQCQREANQYLCSGGWPWNDANDGTCEVSAIKPDNKYNCVFEEVKESSFWMQLENKNKWLFNVANKSSAHISCPNFRQEIIQLPQQGIFLLDAGCTARVNGVILIASRDVQTEDHDNFNLHRVKDVGDTLDIIKPLGSSTINNTKEIEDLKEHISRLKKEDIALRGLRFHSISGHISLILVVIIIIVIIIYFVSQIALKRRMSAISFSFPAQNVQI